MNSQLIVIVQVLIAGSFILWIYSRKGSTPKPTVLNLVESASKPSNHQLNPLNQDYAMSQAASKYNVKKYSRSYTVDDIPIKSKVLNVIFMWNGHSWDAYEVFGLPAGSPIERVNERYSELFSKSDEGQQQFLQAAKTAIENKAAAGS